MKEYIEKQAAIDALDKRFDDVPMELTTEILQLRRDLRERIPSAQPEIIYCKDCVHHIDGFFCRQANHHTNDKDHCASVFRAERRE